MSGLTFTAGGRKVRVFPCGKHDCAVVYLPTFENEVPQLVNALAGSLSDFTLVTVTELSWEHDLSPWECPAVFTGGAPFTGGADEFLRLLTEEIVPKAEENVHAARRCIAGYSLAGLFAVYALYRTDVFSRAASASGSLWFPGFAEFAMREEMMTVSEKLYFSVGDREEKTKNARMKTVRENTERLAEFYKSRGIDTRFHLNAGRHFDDPAGRTAAGIIGII